MCVLFVLAQMESNKLYRPMEHSERLAVLNGLIVADNFEVSSTSGFVAVNVECTNLRGGRSEKGVVTCEV